MRIIWIILLILGLIGGSLAEAKKGYPDFKSKRAAQIEKWAKEEGTENVSNNESVIQSN